MGFVVRAVAWIVVACGCLTALLAFCAMMHKEFYIQCACAEPTAARRPPRAAVLAVLTVLLLSIVLQALAALLDQEVTTRRCRRVITSLRKVAIFASLGLLVFQNPLLRIAGSSGRFCCFAAPDKALVVAGSVVIAAAAFANFLLSSLALVREDE